MDTGAFKARADVADVHHQTALACFEETTSQRLPFYVTNATIWEAYTRLRYDLGYVEAAELFPLVDTLGATVVRVEEEDERVARDLLTRFAEHEFSFVDALNFAVMKRLRISTAFTYDRRHYGVLGFIVIPVP